MKQIPIAIKRMAYTLALYDAQGVFPTSKMAFKSAKEKWKEYLGQAEYIVFVCEGDDVKEFAKTI